MERKIGEIFEYNGEWYQCIIGHCNQCSFNEAGTCKIIGKLYCAYRNDKKLACFKKLEKVGEPFIGKVHIKLQRYKIYTEPIIDPAENIGYVNEENTIAIEIKQNKEDMEEEKIQHYDCFFDRKPTLKEFDINLAKQGKPVCTRDGRKVRIICFDRKSGTPIIALVTELNGIEVVYNYYNNGRMWDNPENTNDCDLMMLTEKKEGWVNVYKRNDEYIWENEYNVATGMAVYESESEAKRNIDRNKIYVDTVKITWGK